MVSEKTVIGETAGLLSEKLNALHKDLNEQQWQDSSRTAFLSYLDSAVSELQAMKGLLEKSREEIEKQSLPHKPELDSVISNYNDALPVLLRNLEMEKKKKERPRLEFEESEETPELYSAAEQKVLDLLLKTRFALERLSAFSRREHFTPLDGKTTARQLLDLVKVKEDELEEMREKYDGLRKRSMLGYIDEETAADLEKELNSLGKTTEVKSSSFARSLSDTRSELEAAWNNYARMQQELDELRDSYSGFSEKNAELVKMLKKERDYAKRTLLDMENETLKLRNTYTSELLNLQDSKLAAKKEAEARLGKTVGELRKELSEKNVLVNSLRKLVESKHERETRLEEKVKQLTLLLKTKQKHEAVKAAFKAAKKKK